MPVSIRQPRARKHHLISITMWTYTEFNGKAKAFPFCFVALQQGYVSHKPLKLTHTAF
ncbi:hypothetical protein R50072_29200 [Simiduia litorea]